MLINQKENRWKYIFKGLGVIFIYFFISFARNIPLRLLNIDLENLPEISYKIYSLIIEIIMFLVIYMIYEPEFNAAIDDIKKNHEKYFKDNFKYYIIGIAVMFGSNMLINFLGGGVSSNEGSVRAEFYSYPIITYISAVFLAPIIEESVFRLSFNALFKNKTLFILTSGLLFGYLHVMSMPLNKLFPLYLLSYSSCGLAFAYMTKRTGNILVPTGFHFMHNGIMMSMQIFLLIFS